MACKQLLCDWERRYLMPPSLEAWLPQRGFGWLNLDAKQGGLEGVLRRPTPAFDAGMMGGDAAVRLQGIRSSGHIGPTLERDVGFRVEAANPSLGSAQSTASERSTMGLKIRRPRATIAVT